MENVEKVTVDARFHAAGGVEPRAVVWDGKEYPIESMDEPETHIDHKRGRVGRRYTIRIRRQQRLLYFFPKPAPGEWLLQIKTAPSPVTDERRERHCCVDLWELGLG